MFERILLAIDETASGEVAVSVATALAADSAATVHVVHANIVLLGGRGVTLETQEQAARVVTAAVDQLRTAGVDASGQRLVTTLFDIGPRIARIAEQMGADVVLLGSHRRRRIGRLVARGVRERVTRATSLPVLTAPSPLTLGRRVGPAAELRRLTHTTAPDQHR